VIPKQGSINYFEPPSVFRPAAGRGAVKRLDEDIAAVLAVADAVVDLDPLGRGFVAGKARQDASRVGEGPQQSAKPT
jgi:hypothetical protein